MNKKLRTTALMLAGATLVAALSAPAAGGDSQLRLTQLRSPDGSIESGGVAQLARSDDAYLETEARVTGEVHQPHLLRLIINAESDARNPSALHFEIEGRITDVEATTTLLLRDWINGGWTQIDMYGMGMVEAVHSTIVNQPENFIRPSDGRVRLEIRQVVFFPFTLNGFHSLFDQVSITAVQ